MNTAPHLRPEDRPDFERVLDQALRADGIRQALRAPGAHLNAEQLRTRALAEIGGIAAAAAVEYHEYTTLRDRVRDGAVRPHGVAGAAARPTAGNGAGALPVLTVLAPILAWAAALIFLLLGYSLRAAKPRLVFADALITAGWVALAVGAVAMVAGVIGLLITALRDSSAPPDGQDPRLHAELATTRDAWKAALMDDGILPFLHLTLAADTPTRTATDRPATGAEPPINAATGVDLVRRRPRLGYTSPGYTSPGPEPTPRRDRAHTTFSSPEYSSPSFSSPDFTSPDYDGAPTDAPGPN
ncbi:hypothetical protein ACIQGZ_01595 [Streptomyces sp. NPDC092296]|uniref:hypothetical protein n=1 Tax=Streptomyces sp. NPDC092296 TaxID=3366012 RepID=UPI00382EBDBA